MTDVFLGVLFALFVLVLANTYSVRDDTDGNTSYVGTALGGLSVRVDKDGKPIKKEQK